MVATLDHIDRVDLEIPKMLNCRTCRIGSVAERLRPIKALGAQPNAPGGVLGKRNGNLGGWRDARL